MRHRATRSSAFVLVAAMIFWFFAQAATAAPGDLDPSFSGGGRTVVDRLPTPESVAVGADGAAFAASAVEASGDTELIVTKLTSSGRPDPSWGEGGSATLDLGLPAGSGVRVDAAFASPDGATTFALRPIGDADLGQPAEIVHLLADGSLDLSFAAGTGLAHLTDVVDFSFTQEGALLYATRQKTVGRLTPAGVPDATLDGDGVVDVIPGSELSEIVGGPAGEIYVADAFDDGTGIIRLTRNGALDASFGAAGSSLARIDGTPLDLAIAADGSSYVLAQKVEVDFANTAIVKVTPSGAFDSSFGKHIGALEAPGAPASNAAFKVVLGQAGRPVAVSSSAEVTGFSLTGAVDRSFGFRGLTKVRSSFFSAEASDAVSGPDGALTIAGGLRGRSSPGTSTFLVARLRAEGGRDDVDLDGALDVDDACPYSPSPRTSGCPVDRRHATINVTHHGLKGTIKAKTPPCFTPRAVQIVRRAGSGTRVLRQVAAKRRAGRGIYFVRSLRPGRYAVRVRSSAKGGDYRCSGLLTRSVRVP